MEMTFSDILASRNLGKIPVLWKLKVTSDEIDAVVAHILRYIDSTLGTEKIGRLIGRELCLLYAYWWSNEYEGGKKSYDDALLKHGIDIRYKPLISRIIKDEFSWKRRNRLNMTLYHGDRQNLYFQSVTSQGGLPMYLFRDPETMSQYESFVGHLISEYEGLDSLERDWNDLSLTREVADRYIQSKTIKDCDEILENAIEFVKAYLEDDENYFENNDEIKKIADRIRESRKKISNTGQFSVQWQFKFLGQNQLNLYYTVKAPHILEDFDVDANVVKFYANNILVGAYQRRGQTFSLIPGTNNLSARICSSISESIKFTMRIPMDNEMAKESEYPLVNSTPPYMEEPLLLQLSNGWWVPYANKNSSDYACLYPSNWYSYSLTDPKPVILFGGEMSFSIIKWTDQDQSSLLFTDKDTGETLSLSKSYSDYSVAITTQIPNWIEDSTMPLLWECNNLSAVFKKFHNGQKITGDIKGFRVSYRMKWQREYQQYHKEKLPCGPLTVRVEFPDKHIRTFSFFNITGMSYERIDDESFSLYMANGHASLLSGQDNVTKVDGEQNLYRLVDTSTSAALRPVYFKVSPDGRYLYGIEIGVRSPRNSVCFLDSKGNILGKENNISFDELYKYKVNLDYNRDIVLSFVEDKKDKKDKRCVLRQNIKIGAGKISLDILSDYIDRMFAIEGFNDNYKYVAIHVDRHRENACIKVKRYSYVAEMTTKNGVTGVVVKQNQRLVTGLTLYACPVSCEETPTKVMTLKEDGEGFYFLDENDAKDVKRCVVFSDNYNNIDKLKPILLKLDDAEDELDRSKLKGESIGSIVHALLNEDESAWDEVKFHTQLAMRYKLPFLNSFNCFQAIASTPSLQAEFITRLPKFGFTEDKEFIVEELTRMEQDLGICFYAIPRMHWQKIIKSSQREYDELISNNKALKGIDGFDCFESFIGTSVMIYLIELLINQFGKEYAPFVFYKLINNLSLQQFPIEEQLMNKNNCTDFTDFNTPDELSFPQLIRQPRDIMKWSSRLSEWKKFHFLSIAIPQDIALQTLGNIDDLWLYCRDEDKDIREKTNKAREFKRRIHNYLRKYDRERYNNLFCHVLLRLDPKNQGKSNKPNRNKPNRK